MKPNQLTSVLACLLLAMCISGVRGAAPDLAWQHAQADPVREALFYYLIKTNSTGLYPTIIYLAVRDGSNYHDPDRHVLKDFGGGKPPVKPVSTRPHKSPYIQDGSHIIGAGPITWKSHDQVDLEGSDLCGLKCGNIATYGVQYKDAHWIVIGRTSRTICF